MERSRNIELDELLFCSVQAQLRWNWGRYFACASNNSSNIFDSMPSVLKSSWQSSTHRIEVAFVMALVSIVSGLVRLRRKALLGQIFSISLVIWESAPITGPPEQNEGGADV
ncbi:hypothetical protein BH18ACT10_BH18ACT10_09080 [soil metagenome]